MLLCQKSIHFLEIRGGGTSRSKFGTVINWPRIQCAYLTEHYQHLCESERASIKLFSECGQHTRFRQQTSKNHQKNIKTGDAQLIVGQIPQAILHAYTCEESEGRCTVRLGKMAKIIIGK